MTHFRDFSGLGSLKERKQQNKQVFSYRQTLSVLRSNSERIYRFIYPHLDTKKSGCSFSKQAEIAFTALGLFQETFSAPIASTC